MRRGFSLPCAVVALSVVAARAEQPKKPPKPPMPKPEAARGVDLEREMGNIRERVEELERRREELIERKGLKEDHPEVRKLDENIGRLEAELSAIEKRVDRAHAQIEKQVDQLHAKAEALGRHRDELVETKKLKEDDPKVRALDEQIKRLRTQAEELARRLPHEERRGLPPELEAQMDRLRGKIEELERDRNALITKMKLKAGHPRIRQLDQAIDHMKRQLKHIERQAEHIERPGMRPPPPELSAEYGRPRPPSPELLEKLRAPMPEIEFPDVPLDQVIKSLRDQRKINIYVEWRVLEMIDVDRETPVLVPKLTDVPLATAIDMVLRSTGETPGALGYYVDGNVIVITSREWMQTKGPLSPQADALLQRLQHERPDVYARLMYLRQTDPDAFHEELLDLGPLPPPPPERSEEPMRELPIAKRMEAREMEEVRRHDPERFELMRRDEELTNHSIELAERVRRAKEPKQKGELANELKELLNQQFDIRMQIRRLEVKDLARRLDELKAGLERRIRRKPELIERRMNELLNPEETEW